MALKKENENLLKYNCGQLKIYGSLFRGRKIHALNVIFLFFKLSVVALILLLACLEKFLHIDLISRTERNTFNITVLYCNAL